MARTRTRIPIKEKLNVGGARNLFERERKRKTERERERERERARERERDRERARERVRERERERLATWPRTASEGMRHSSSRTCPSATPRLHFITFNAEREREKE